MNKRGAQLGNNNAKKNRKWSDAVRRAVMRGDNLNKLADVLVSKAADGDLAALREVGDRIEGKVSLRESFSDEVLIVQVNR